MEYKKSFFNNLKTPISVIISALFATFVFSVGNILLDHSQYENLIWIIDTTFYSFIVSAFLDWLIFMINKKRTIVEISFYNPIQKSNNLNFEKSDQYHNIKVYITVYGKSHNFYDVLRIYEPEGITLQLSNQPEYINVEDGSYYEINLTKLIGVEKEGRYLKKENMTIKRSLEFQVALDDYEDEYEDKLYVHRDILHPTNRWTLSLKQNQMKIEQ